MTGRSTVSAMEVRLKKEYGCCNVHGCYKGAGIFKMGPNDSSLVQWKCVSDFDESCTADDVFVWMENQEIARCCPNVKVMPLKDDTSDHDTTNDVLGLQAEVITWVTRAKQVMSTATTSGHDEDAMLANTMYILSGYAKFTYLVDTFKSSGAIDISLELLSSTKASDVVKRHAREILLTLSALDISQTNSFILSMLIKGESKLSLDDQEVLLDMSQVMLSQLRKVDHTYPTQQIHLSQLPSGSVLCSFINKYLKVNALKTKMNVTVFGLPVHALDVNLRHEKEYFDLVFDFVNDFLKFQGCFDTTSISNHYYTNDSKVEHEHSHQFASFTAASSISNGIVPLKSSRTTKKAMSRSDFKSNAEYTIYLQQTLKPGMKVMLARTNHRNRHVHSSVGEGAIGTFLDSVLQPEFIWEGEDSSKSANQISWEQIEICEEQSHEMKGHHHGQWQSVTKKRPSKMPFHSLHQSSVNLDANTVLTRNQWWEILCTIHKFIPFHQTNEVFCITKTKSMDELMRLNPSVFDAVPVIMLLKNCVPLSVWESLAIVQELLLRNPDFFKKHLTTEVMTTTSIKLKPPYPDPFLLDEEDHATQTEKKNDPDGDYKEIQSIKDLKVSDLLVYSPLKIAEDIRSIIKNNHGKCKIAVYIVNCLLSIMPKRKHDHDYIKFCEAGLFNLTLELMSQEPNSYILQTVGIKCFYFLMGPAENDGLLSHVSSTVMSTLVSLASSQEESAIMEVFVNGIKCIANYYNFQMSEIQKKAVAESIGYGTMILATILNLNLDNFVNLSGKYKQWKVPSMVETVLHCNVNFAFKKELCFFLSHCDDHITSNPVDSVNWLIKTLKYFKFLNKMPSIKDLNNQGTVNTPVGLFVGMVTRYLTLLGIETPITDEFISLPKEASTMFVSQGGVLCLSNIIMSSDNIEVKKICVVLMGCLSMDIEVCEILATQQGGLNAAISILQSKQMNMELVVDLCIGLLFNMSQSKNAFALMVDCAVPSLFHLLKKRASCHKYYKELVEILSDYEDETAIKLKCSRNRTIFSNICLGFIDVVLDDIRNARRTNQMPGMPFIKKIFQVNCKKNIDGGVERVEASSGASQVSHLMDGNPNTYWESSSSNDIWIKLYMANHALVKKLSVTFREYYNSNHKITIKGVQTDDNSGDYTVIKMINDFTWKNNSVTLLEDLNDHYSAIMIMFTSKKEYFRYHHTICIREISCDTAVATSPFEILFAKFMIQTQFYYSIQCQSWTSSNSLQIFDKVIRALHFEQKLADHLCLSNDKQVLLGKACKLSLIKKFLEIVSKNDDIGQLLESYILSVDVSSNTIKLCSTIMSVLPHSSYHCTTGSHGVWFKENNNHNYDKSKLSDIRRMCRFLVDYCSSDTQGDGTSSEPFFVQTWERVVKFAYATLVKQTDFSCHSFISITELFIFNEKVKQAATELFKGHPMVPFVTRAGMQNAVSSLDLTTTIKLCQCICVFIHQLLSMKTSTSMTVTLESSEIMTILSELANSLPLLSIFELLYRKYLVERTLNEKINISLELNVAKAFAECFPSVTPLSMIEDLTKSQILFDIFKQSCKQALDQELYDQNNAGHQNSAATEQLIADKMMAYQLVEFHVTVLSPSLWPSGLSSIPMGALELVHPLKYFVTDCTNYFFKERKTLTWTQYGRAQIKCNNTSILLNISTIQMIIIMAFNDIVGKAEMLSFDEIVKRTSVSYVEISKALNALTTGYEHNYTEPLLKLTNEDNKPLPHISNGAETQLLSTVGYYSINEKLFEKLLKCGKNEVSFNPPASLDIRADDLQVISRRRNNIIRTQIVKLMKRERQLSAYEVYTSIKSVCSSVQFRHWFGNFDCSYYDIQKEIDYLVQTEFLKCQHNNPLIIEYVVDDQADSYSEQLIHEDTSNILLFEKSKNSSCSLKTENESGYVNLFQMPPNKADMNLQTLKEAIQADISTVASILNVDSDLAESLLADCSWNKEKLLNDYFEDEEYCKKHGFNCSSLNDSKMVITDCGCPICLDQENSNFVTLRRCGHICCTECWYKYFQIVTKDTLQTVAKCCCMYNDCSVKPTITFVDKIVDKKPDRNIILTKFHESILHTFIEHNCWLGFCKNPQGCDGLVCTYYRDYSETAQCDKCLWSSCISCNFVEAHNPASCEEVRQWIEAGGFHQGMNDEAKSAYLASKIAKQCPKCRMQIEKNDGCLHMTCECGYHFCWKCLKSWGENHTNYYECKEEANGTINISERVMKQSRQCEKINELKVAANDMFRRINEEKGYLVTKAFPILHAAQSALVECYRVQFYMHIVEIFNDSLDSFFSTLRDDLVSKTRKLQVMLDTFIFLTNDNEDEVYQPKPEFVCSISQLLALIRNTFKKVSFGAKEGFRLCSLTSKHVSDIDQVLMGDSSLMRDKRDLNKNQGTLLHRFLSENDFDRLEDYDDINDDDFQYDDYFDDDDY